MPLLAHLVARARRSDVLRPVRRPHHRRQGGQPCRPVSAAAAAWRGNGQARQAGQRAPVDGRGHHRSTAAMLRKVLTVAVRATAAAARSRSPCCAPPKAVDGATRRRRSFAAVAGGCGGCGRRGGEVFGALHLAGQSARGYAGGRCGGEFFDAAHLAGQSADADVGGRRGAVAQARDGAPAPCWAWRPQRRGFQRGRRRGSDSASRRWRPRRRPSSCGARKEE